MNQLRQWKMEWNTTGLNHLEKLRNDFESVIESDTLLPGRVSSSNERTYRHASNLSRAASFSTIYIVYRAAAVQSECLRAPPRFRLRKWIVGAYGDARSRRYHHRAREIEGIRKCRVILYRVHHIYFKPMTRDDELPSWRGLTLPLLCRFGATLFTQTVAMNATSLKCRCAYSAHAHMMGEEHALCFILSQRFEWEHTGASRTRRAKFPGWSKRTRFEWGIVPRSSGCRWQILASLIWCHYRSRLPWVSRQALQITKHQCRSAANRGAWGRLVTTLIAHISRQSGIISATGGQPRSPATQEKSPVREWASHRHAPAVIWWEVDRLLASQRLQGLEGRRYRSIISGSNRRRF